jgi:hypothetical protein
MSQPTRFLPVACAVITLLGATSPVLAATISTRTTIGGTLCAASGDPTCAGTAGSLPGLPNQSVNGSAVTGAIVQSAVGYIDPRLGTANSANATAIGGAGFLQLTADASVSSSPPLGQGSPNLLRLSGAAEATLLDQLTINAPTPAQQGQTATVTASLLVTGSLSASGVNANPGGGILGGANWQVAWATSTGGFGGSISSFTPGFFGGVTANVNGSFPQGPATPATIPIQFVIQFGVPFDLSLAGRVVALASVSSGSAKPITEGITAGSASAQFGNTFAWNGIQSITRQGQAITGFTVTSASGADYANAITATVVPLPAGVWLLGSATLLLAARARRREPGSAPVSIPA